MEAQRNAPRIANKCSFPHCRNVLVHSNDLDVINTKSPVVAINEIAIAKERRRTFVKISITRMVVLKATVDLPNKCLMFRVIKFPLFQEKRIGSAMVNG